MLKIHFLHPAQQKSNWHKHDAEYMFFDAVILYINNTFKIKNVRGLSSVKYIYEDEKLREYMEIIWVIDDSREIVQHKKIYLNYEIAKTKHILSQRKAVYLSKKRRIKNA